MVAKYAIAVLSILPLILLAIMCPEIPSNVRTRCRESPHACHSHTPPLPPPIIFQ